MSYTEISADGIPPMPNVATPDHTPLPLTFTTVSILETAAKYLMEERRSMPREYRRILREAIAACRDEDGEIACRVPTDALYVLTLAASMAHADMRLHFPRSAVELQRARLEATNMIQRHLQLRAEQTIARSRARVNPRGCLWQVMGGTLVFFGLLYGVIVTGCALVDVLGWK